MNIRHTPDRQRGGAAIELALVLPLLLLIALGAYDFSNAIRTDMVLVNISREGANLMSRGADSPAYAQLVMNALGNTAMPQYGENPGTSWANSNAFAQNSQILVTRIQAVAAGAKVNATVTEQYHWLRGGITPVSQVWNCSSSWKADGSCAIPSPAPMVTLANLANTDALNPGDVFFTVEVFHDYDAMFGGAKVGLGMIVPTAGPSMYAISIF